MRLRPHGQRAHDAAHDANPVSNAAAHATDAADDASCLAQCSAVWAGKGWVVTCIEGNAAAGHVNATTWLWNAAWPYAIWAYAEPDAWLCVRAALVPRPSKKYDT